MNEKSREDRARSIYIRLREEIDERAQLGLDSFRSDDGGETQDPTLQPPADDAAQPSEG